MCYTEIMTTRERGLPFTLVHPDYTYQHELHIFDYIDKINVKEENFYDLGACVGIFSLYAASRGLTCIAFEIDPDNFIGLNGNISANNFSSKVKIFNKGVSDGKDTEAILQIPPGKQIGGHNKILKMQESTAVDSDRSHYQQILVPVDSLDNYVEKFNLPIPLNAKVDIDGSELAFLRGAPKALTTLKSLMIEIFEINPLHKEVLAVIDSYKFILHKKHIITQPGCVGYYNYEFWK